MTFLAFASIIFAFVVAVASVILAFNSPTVANPTAEPVQNVAIHFEVSQPAYQAHTLDLHKVKRTDHIQRRFNVIAMLASREVAQDSIEWATAKDAITCKYSVNPLAMSRRARFGFDQVFEGAACVVRCQDLMSDYDVAAAIANW